MDNHLRCLHLLRFFLLTPFLAASALATIPFNSAKVSFVENDVKIGALAGGNPRPASTQDVVLATDYLQTETASRAELIFEDRSIVRVGQNAIFTFDAASRTLSLQKGTMMFFVPPGSGGGKIKTPSLTAAITGTVGKVSKEKLRELIAVLSGELDTAYGRVPAGWVIEWYKGKVRIYRFDPTETTKGKLYFLGGRPFPEEPEVLRNQRLQQMGIPDLHRLDLSENTRLYPEINDAPPPPERNDDEEDPPPAVRPRATPSVPTPTPHTNPDKTPPNSPR